MSASGSQFSVFMEPKVNFEPQESDLTSVYRLLLSRSSSDTLVGVVERPLLLYTSFTQKKFNQKINFIGMQIAKNLKLKKINTII